MNKSKLSVVVPVYNEGLTIISTVRNLKDLLEMQSFEAEIIVVNDGSTDDFSRAQKELEALESPSVPIRIFSNTQNIGYGFSLKRGIQEAKYDSICIVDADGTYPIHDIPRLHQSYLKGFDMVVGARTGKHVNHSYLKYLSRKVFIFIAEFTTGRKIKDINSGFRIFRRDVALRYKDILSSGFSFTTTITILFMQENLFVEYLDIDYFKREGKTKVKHVRDALRALQLIAHCILVSNPVKLYLLMCLLYIVGMLAVSPLIIVSNILFIFFAMIISVIFLLLGLGCLSVQNSLMRRLSGDS